ncbi:hypothetical protein PR202_ga25323 [Eleusine coracana subsp. coracana]|uniref:non-specific serine/threonine protein kinase n=1 Tax=Eleusine coracana subsp. coracana TaxID=191504 RepID=A0AAV5DAE4_ELECO|nr:hypothetical protein PR202_ga25323 [Eleusine coracana subsp. coracana]
MTMARSLRRVLIPLVLLSGLAFRGVGFDCGGAPEPLALPPPPPRLALPGASGPREEDGPARSTEVVAAALPKKKARDFLVLPRARRSEHSSVVSSDSDALPRFDIRINNNGTVQCVDRLSNAPLWEIYIGPPPSSEEVTTGDPAVSYAIYLDGRNGNELVEYNNGTRVILPWKLEEFVARTPYIRDSVVTIGSKVSTIFFIDADHGEIINKHSSPAVLNKLEGPVVEGTPSKLTARTNDIPSNTVMIVRDDYSVSASDLGKHLFNWTRSFFTAYYPHNHPNTLDQPSYLQGGIPYIKTGVPLALPDSTSDNAIVLRDLIPIATRDDAGALKPHPTSRKSLQTDGKSHIALDSTQNQTYDADYEATNKFNKNSYGWLFPVLPILLVIGYLLSLTSASRSCRQFVIQLMKPFMHDKKPVDVRGKAEGTPNKRRKQRKRDGLINGHENLSASDKESGETGGSADSTIKENRILTNNGIDGLDGRQIGKLYVSSKEIGRGSNGTVVFEGSYDGRQVAVKRLLRSHNDIAIKETENLIISDRDPNIVRLYGCEHDNDFVYIALERCKCSLADLIQKHSDSEVIVLNSKISNAEGIDVELWTQDGLPSSQLLKLMRDVVAGLAHLHSVGIIHRDLKPHNVLISTDGPIRAKLSDMGISKRLQEDITSFSHHGTGVGSSGWQAPEQLRNGRQTRAMDLFSLGCLIFYCITKGKHPFGEYYERDMNIVNNRFDLFMVDYIPEAVHLLSQLLQPNPELRPSAVNVMHHPFFWSPELCLSFLRDTSDRIEKTSETDLINALESIGPVAFGGKWGEKLDPALVTDMGRYRKYNFESIRDLLRYIRNKSGHYRELSDDLKKRKLTFGCWKWYAESGSKTMRKEQVTHLII